LMLHSALSWCGVRQHFFRFGKTADILPTRLLLTVDYSRTQGVTPERAFYDSTINQTRSRCAWAFS